MMKRQIIRFYTDKMILEEFSAGQKQQIKRERGMNSVMPQIFHILAQYVRHVMRNVIKKWRIDMVDKGIPEIFEYDNFDDIVNRNNYDNEADGGDFIACKIYDPEEGNKEIWKYFSVSKFLGDLVEEIQFLPGDNKL